MPWPTCVPKGCKISFQPTDSLPLPACFSSLLCPRGSSHTKAACSTASWCHQEVQGSSCPRATRAVRDGSDGQSPFPSQGMILRHAPILLQGVSDAPDPIAVSCSLIPTLASLLSPSHFLHFLNVLRGITSQKKKKQKTTSA